MPRPPYAGRYRRRRDGERYRRRRSPRPSGVSRQGRPLQPPEPDRRPGAWTPGRCLRPRPRGRNQGSRCHRPGAFPFPMHGHCRPAAQRTPDRQNGATAAPPKWKGAELSLAAFRVLFHVKCQLQDASQPGSEVTHTEPWSCPTCHTTVSTPYCPVCGERPLHPRELTFRGLLDQLVGAFTAVDGRLIRSLRYLVSRPGFLTVAYLHGQRKPYPRAAPALPGRERAVLRLRIVDRRQGFHDAARRAPAYAALESRRRTSRVASARGETDHARSVRARVRPRRRRERAIAHRVHGAVVCGRARDGVSRKQAPAGGSRTVLVPPVRLPAPALLHRDGRPAG